MRGLDGKVAIVTGGATIVGAGVAFVRTDVTADGDVEACVTGTVERCGGLDVLVNLACSYVDDGVASSRADWLTSYDVNVVGAAMMLRAARPHLVARGGGAVVNFGSISAKVAQTGRWLYPATKAAMLQLTRSAALDLAGDGIRVNSVPPGWTWSKVMDELSGGDRRHTDAVAADFHLLRRVGDPDEVAQAVLFLCSEDASFITGTDLAVDGGYTAMGPERAEPAIPLLAKGADA